jgi:putative flippase GtrA
VYYLCQIRNIINLIIDWLYKPFQGFIRKDTFRYAVCGGSNTALDIILYFITYNFILRKTILDLKIVSISPHIASFLIVFPITFSTGFLLSKYITFTESELRGKVQLFRYGVTVFMCIILNYVFLKLFVEFCGFYPTPSKLLTTVFVVIYSYFSQRHYTFKTVGNGIDKKGEI